MASSSVPPLRRVFLELAEEHEAKARRLEQCATEEALERARRYRERAMNCRLGAAAANF